ncbi:MULTISPECIES: hypothetical protein [Bacteria]|jgi:hypothetical protein|uniref:hypothetical protein n=1 Tax=Bacteria TaxID=2 RepID=UPI0014040824|nr:MULTISPECIES: hypothetical protein [Bacteria]
MAIDPDPRTAPDETFEDAAADAPNQGVSSTDPAEGDDDAPAGTDGSPDQA